MKTNVPVTKTTRHDRTPTTQRNNLPSLFTPSWFDDFWEATRWFNDFSQRDLLPNYRDNRFLAPAIDIDETSSDYIVMADLPGIKKEDIAVECAGNQLTISAERKYESEGDDKRSNRRERYYGTYQRSFTLPMGADADKVEATFDGGVLTIKIAKSEEAKARRIEIGKPKSTTANVETKH